MQSIFSKNFWHPFVTGFATLSLGALAVSVPAVAQEQGLDAGVFFFPGNLVVSRSVYDNNANNVKVGALLAPNCANTATLSGTPCVAAISNGIYPFVFNNVMPDPPFGITSNTFLDQIIPFGFVLF